MVMQNIILTARFQTPLLRLPTRATNYNSGDYRQHALQRIRVVIQSVQVSHAMRSVGVALSFSVAEKPFGDVDGLPKVSFCTFTV